MRVLEGGSRGGSCLLAPQLFHRKFTKKTGSKMENAPLYWGVCPLYFKLPDLPLATIEPASWHASVMIIIIADTFLLSISHIRENNGEQTAPKK